jgi:HmuY protein
VRRAVNRGGDDASIFFFVRAASCGNVESMRSFDFLSVLAIAIPLTLGCSSDPNNPSGSTTSGSGSSSSGGGGGGSGGGGGEGGSAPTCMIATPIACEDQVVQQMDFKKNVAPGLIVNAAEANGFSTEIDARAGGFMYTDSYVYGKFTDKGLEKAELTDEQSIASGDWDIAFRRFIIRINSGNSGPSCTKAARLKTGTLFDDVTTAPVGANYLADEYFSAACELIPDGSGLGSPATVMSGFWTYVNCVQMTDNVYVIETSSGAKVKLVVTDYYEPSDQELCDTTGAVPMGTPGGFIKIRWAFLP